MAGRSSTVAAILLACRDLDGPNTSVEVVGEVRLKVVGEGSRGSNIRLMYG